MQEILVILVLALIFLGPKKLPELASGIGKAIREVRKATADIKQEIELDDAIRKPLEELREATMLPPEELKRRDEERKWRAQREKEEAERIARGETAGEDAGPVVGSHDDPDTSYSAEDYHHDEDGHETGYNEADPNSHAPLSNDETSALNAAASSADVDAVDATVRDLPPAAPAPVAAPAAGKPMPAGLGGRTPDDRTIAMPLPPPMEGSAGSVAPSLPPPRRLTPPPPPADALAMKAPPPGAVARPTATLFGVAPPAVPPAARPPAGPAPVATADPARTTAPLGVKLPPPPPGKKPDENA